MLDLIGVGIGVIALVPVIYFLRDRYLGKRFLFTFDTKNTFLGHFYSPGHTMHESIGIVFYGLRIVNAGRASFTLKDCAVKYQAGDSTHVVDSYVLQTGTLPDGQPAIIARSSTGDIVLMGWSNLRPEIGKGKLVDPGGILSASAFFVLPGVTIKALDELSQIEIVLRDYLGKESAQTIDLDDEWKEYARSGVRILNQPFTSDGGQGGITFV